MFRRLIEFSIGHPRLVLASALGITLLFATQFPRINIDTDPENMLSQEEWVRVFHNRVKEEFSIHDLIVVGIVNEETEEGVFTPETLTRVAAITEEILDIPGVIIRDVISPTTVDNIQTKNGFLSVDRLMKAPPRTREEAQAIKEAALENPLLRDKLVSHDGQGLALYVPIEKKDLSYRISRQIEEIIARYPGPERYYISGLPVAEDTFGYEMFRQMGISAPLAGLIILLLLLFFFRKLTLVISPMIVAVFSVLWAMGLLIAFGLTVHIMSSMIPIFLMPIAVVDSVHILSEFHDQYPEYRSREQTIRRVMAGLFLPMLYTSLTSAVGFASLALTPIPPVRVFGLFVAFGILAAWLLTITLVPASIMLIRERSLERVGGGPERKTILSRLLPPVGRFALAKSKLLVGAMGAVVFLSILGITRIVVNDNPVKWFEEDHKIRVADRVLNDHFGGTYMAYLVLEGEEPGTMKRPAVLSAIADLQRELESLEVVGKTSSLADIVRKVGYELRDKDPRFDRIPESAEEIGQYLFLFEMSGDPDDLFDFVDREYKDANIWIQMKRGENREMEGVVKTVEQYLDDSPIPGEIEANWAGLTYLNIIWQEKMVLGMFRALMGGVVVVFLMMVLLYRSALWALLSMIPLSLTILVIYGVTGFVGKEYDMPVAVLSTLTLGLSIDFAIHFIQRTRALYPSSEDWQQTIGRVFGEPARAISRNAILIAVGFLPLVVAPLTPYQTVGVYLASIMLISGLATLVILPALVAVLHGRLFGRTGEGGRSGQR